MLPVSAESGVATRPVTALFTTVSLVCVTGLIIVDTPTCWSTIGELVILLMIQLGGLGIMTVATLLLLLVARRIGLHLHLTAVAETRAVGLSRWSLHVRVTVITTRSCSSSALPRSSSASGQPAHHRPGRYPWQDRDRDVPRDPTPHRRLQQHRHGPSRAVTLLITNVLM
jgi:hypothetical protein